MREEWSDFEKYVFEKLSHIEKQLSALQVKATLWGGLAGLVPVVLWLAIEHFK